MNKSTNYLASNAEGKFIELFTEIFDIENTQYIAVQYPFVDIYGNNKFIDFTLESEDVKIAIEIDGEIVHDKRRISDEKYYDELMRQNSLIYQSWKLYRWTGQTACKVS